MALIRGATYLHGHHDYGPWMALLGGMVLTFVVLFIYFTVIRGVLLRSIGDYSDWKRRGYLILFILIGYTAHGLFFMSTSNMKNRALAKEVRELHPIVRVAVSTIILIDRDLIITDASRSLRDYDRMGIPRNESSLHFPQKDGYVYAIDLRTNQRSWLRNTLLQNYFRLMGFQTLQHGGTGPHLHIALKRKR